MEQMFKDEAFTGMSLSFKEIAAWLLLTLYLRPPKACYQFLCDGCMLGKSVSEDKIGMEPHGLPLLGGMAWW